MDRFIKKSVNYLLKLFVKDTQLPDKVTDMNMRKKYAYLEAWVSIIGNLVLTVIKIIMGLTLNSISLLADAVHTASDVLTSIVVLLGFKISSVPADKKNPYGHGRIEFISSLIIAVTYIGRYEFGKIHTRLLSNCRLSSFQVAIIMVIAQ